ncbi:mechanosensitive ion channel family protein [Halomicrobium sp. LC1Hm]|uniref:mechanosensitive ion channel family protein n=1 Tax=Halomicrobium sp. LC1Hm TaxID=2610902 RepID=UPI0012982875|nr:mechanosensitive ion channel family protein [Halomicrobium sp. LC1Hm]QGA81753.1 Small-conductance mechanosensitive channel [Halomicrobium sp. LC1Hm]
MQATTPVGDETPVPTNGSASNWPVFQDTVASVFGEGQRFLEELATTQGRAAVTAVLVIAALLAVFVVVPLLVRQIRRVLASRLFDSRVADGVELVGMYIPTTISGIALRVLQVSVLIVGALSLLVVWGLVDVAVATGGLILAAIPNLVKATMTAVLLVLAYVGSDQLRTVIDRFSQGADRVTQHQEEVMLRVGQVVLLVTVGSSIMTLWGIDLSGLLVGAGFLGIVVGLAARQTLGSLIAGFVLMFSRPFTVGDWIEVGGQEGIVTDITILNTRLQNFDGETVVLPNDKVNDQSLTNRSSNGRLRLRTEVGIDYDADPDDAEAVALDAIEAVEIIEDAPAPKVIPKAFGDSAIVLELRYWIEHPSPPRKWRAVSGVVSGVKEAFDDEGITVPYPQRELSARDGTATQLRDGQLADGQPSAGADGETE